MTLPADRAAEAARLGRLVEAFPYRSHNRVTELALAVFGAIVFGAVAVLALGSAEGRFWAFIAGPLAVLSVLVAVASFRRATGNRARQVCLYEGGFVVVDGARADAWSWPEVESVWQRIVDHRDQSGMRLSTDARWTVLRRDGVRIVLSNDDIDGIDRLGGPIIRRTTEALLPQALADLQPARPCRSARGGSACRASAASASSSLGPTSRGSWWPTARCRCWRRAGCEAPPRPPSSTSPTTSSCWPWPSGSSRASRGHERPRPTGRVRARTWLNV
jgi:hypothetical protein